MKTVCAWCQKLIKGDSRDPRVSHGICAACFKRETGREPRREKNPDEDLRRLERAARAGDRLAVKRIAAMRRRTDPEAYRRSLLARIRELLSPRDYDFERASEEATIDELEQDLSNIDRFGNPDERLRRAERAGGIRAVMEIARVHAPWMTTKGLQSALRVSARDNYTTTLGPRHEVRINRTKDGARVVFYHPFRVQEVLAETFVPWEDAGFSAGPPVLNPRRSKNPMKCKNPCRNPRHRHSNPWDAQQLDGVAQLATSVYSGARTFGFANPGGDESLRSLERAADRGDIGAFQRLHAEVKRRGILPPGYTMHALSDGTGFFATAPGVKAKPFVGMTVYNTEKKAIEAARGHWFVTWHSRHGWAVPNPAACWNCGSSVSGDVCRKCWAGQNDYMNPRERNPRRRARKHKPGCACAACSAHRKKVGRRTGASRASSSHVKALDHFIATKMKSNVKFIQKCLMTELKHGRYSRTNAAKKWRQIIDAACNKSQIPLSAAHRAQMASQVADAFERKIRHGNPSVAIVGAGLNPGRRSSNPTDSRKKGDRGYVGTISLAEARKRAVAAGMGRQFDENVRAHKKFHGSAPSGVRVYRSNDGKKAKTVEVGSISGRVPETTYISGKVVDKSNKANRFYVHKHPAKGQPVEVWLAHKKSALKVGGTQKRTSWYYH